LLVLTVRYCILTYSFFILYLLIMVITLFLISQSLFLFHFILFSFADGFTGTRSANIHKSISFQVSYQIIIKTVVVCIVWGGGCVLGQPNTTCVETKTILLFVHFLLLSSIFFAHKDYVAESVVCICRKYKLRHVIMLIFFFYIHYFLIFFIY
jgi:hypothetical protein